MEGQRSHGTFNYDELLEEGLDDPDTVKQIDKDLERVYLDFEKYRPSNFNMKIGKMRKGSFSQISNSSSRRNSGTLNLGSSFLSTGDIKDGENSTKNFERRKTLPSGEEI